MKVKISTKSERLAHYFIFLEHAHVEFGCKARLMTVVASQAQCINHRQQSILSKNCNCAVPLRDSNKERQTAEEIH